MQAGTKFCFRLAVVTKAVAYGLHVDERMKEEMYSSTHKSSSSRLNKVSRVIAVLERGA